MAYNILDAQDAGHSAAMDVRKAAAELLEEWFAPLRKRQEQQTAAKVLQIWELMPPEMRSAMEKKDPAQYARVKAKVAELKKSLRNE